MGPEGIILVNPPITTVQQSLTHSAMLSLSVGLLPRWLTAEQEGGGGGAEDVDGMVDGLPPQSSKPSWQALALLFEHCLKRRNHIFFKYSLALSLPAHHNSSLEPTQLNLNPITFLDKQKSLLLFFSHRNHRST